MDFIHLGRGVWTKSIHPVIYMGIMLVEYIGEKKRSPSKGGRGGLTLNGLSQSKCFFFKTFPKYIISRFTAW